jgi:hypothetical protein
MRDRERGSRKGLKGARTPIPAIMLPLTIKTPPIRFHLPLKLHWGLKFHLNLKRDKHSNDSIDLTLTTTLGDILCDYSHFSGEKLQHKSK